MTRGPTALALALALAACSESPADAPSSNAPNDASVSSTGTGPADPAEAYASMCAACHGEVGEGGTGTRLVDTPRDLNALAVAIDARMPLGNPGACRGACATSLARFIKDTFTSAALACPTVPPSPRRIRLLNRREYRNTLRDLLAPASDAPASAAPCTRRTFTYDTGDRDATSVSVAGSFNAWSTTAWPLTRVDGTRRWTLTRDLEVGTHQYKFVVDGRDWVRDPSNPDTAPDGFNGQNSVLVVRCDASGGGSVDTARDPAANLPVETRPQGFLFDTHADAALATAVHVSEYARAAAALATSLGARVRRLASCDDTTSDAACVDRFVTDFGARAFRRPLTDAEVSRYRALATRPGGLDAGLARALRAMLSSPAFLYRSEVGEAQPDGRYKLTPWEAASALSYALWATTPDAALLAAARDGTLSTAAGVEREARRLLNDPRAREQFGVFALQWLNVESVPELPRDRARFPDYSAEVGSAMVEETRRFVTAVVFDGTHTVGEVFTADWSLMNARLAGFYGFTGPTGDDFTRVSLPPERRGVLGHGSVLLRTSHSDQSSPILRGVWVRRNLLCQEFPPPPPNAGGVPDVDPTATTRERFRQHTANVACRTCHGFIDDVGFGFERFDAVGRVRAMENGLAVDTRGRLVDMERWGAGTSLDFDQVGALGAALAESDTARRCAVRQYYRFARGYTDTARDRCAVNAAVDAMRSRNGDLREAIVAVFTSPDFLWRR
ncbi:MAG: DUF1592 domain-containing protein [Polyangiales bacterium]